MPLAYASFLGISKALHLDIFRQPLRSWFFDSLNDFFTKTTDQRAGLYVYFSWLKNPAQFSTPGYLNNQDLSVSENTSRRLRYWS
jgi:hypothetical protein